jgi:hypothetical protein
MKFFTNPSPMAARIMLVLIGALLIFVGIPALRWVDASDRAELASKKQAYAYAAEKYAGATFSATNDGRQITVIVKDNKGQAVLDRKWRGDSASSTNPRPCSIPQWE